jgi:hypothetical protein
VTSAKELAQMNPNPGFPSLVALDRPARTPFLKEGRMVLANATNFYWKSDKGEAKPPWQIVSNLRSHKGGSSVSTITYWN